jgi:hypothetical protein
VLAVLVAVLAIYRPALSAFFFEDDFQWLATRLTFHPADLFDLAGRSHFYRPVVELYFWAGTAWANGSPVVLHAASLGVHLIVAGLVWAMASSLGWRAPWAGAAAALFAVQSSFVQAVAWVGAIAEPITTAFGCLAVWTDARARRAGRRGPPAVSVAAFTLALLTHESGVVFFPLLVLAGVLAAGADWCWRDAARRALPFAAVIAAYLAVDLTINARHYAVTSGGYALGPHVVPHIFQYLASLYVGERTLVWHAIVGVVLAAILLRGTPRARFAAAWMLLAILPFAPFSEANVSRYAYMPAVGLALLIAEGCSVLDERLLTAGRAWGRAVALGLALVVAVRFGVIASKGVREFCGRTERYRTFLADVRRAHPDLADGASIGVDAALEARMPLRFLEAAVQWEYRNPTLRVVVEPRREGAPH